MTIRTIRRILLLDVTNLSNNTVQITNVDESRSLEDVPVLPLKDPDIVTAFLVQNQKLVSEYFFKCLKKAVVRNLPEVVLFRLGESEMVSTIKSIDYEDQLNKLMDFYSSEDEFERASECRNLIVKHKVNRLIEESNTM